MKQKGTHLPKTKSQLSELERELLEALLELHDVMSIPLITAKGIAEEMGWDIRQTTSTLSNLVGMDLCIETDGKTKITNQQSHEFSSSEPLYGIPKDSVIHKRAVYAKERKGDGVTLWHILNADKDKEETYGMNLWPFRPVDRVKVTGRIRRDEHDRPQIVLSYKPSDFEDMVGQDVTVRIDLKV